ncbi:YadA-like family protein, partial [Erwinia sp. V90_4]|uniref:YadA family autotransporter adhesin n=1 Tax=Erwinia sp. V90_4 TaxID=3044239 RepID=UPI00249F3266
VQGATKNNVGDALGTLDTVITKHGSSIKSIKNSMEFMQNDINDLKSGGSGLIKQDKVTGDISVGKNTSGNRVDFSNLSESGEKKSRKLSGVSEGEISSTSTDAVNGKQLYETNKQVKDNADRINGIAAGINDVVSGKSGIVKQKNANGTITIGSETDGNAVSIAGKSGDRVIKGVKDGINENDAATVGQLNKISGSAKMIAINNKKNSNVPTASGENAIAIGPSSVSSGNKSISMGENAVASGNNSVALGQGSKASAANSVALGSGSLADQDNTFSVGNSMQQRRITNVAPGVKTNDAVTVGQLNSVRSEVNKNFMKLKNDLNNIDRKLTAGIASSMAMSGIPQAYQPDSSFMGGSIASYNGAGAVAIGASKVSQSGRYVTKVQGSLNSQNDVGMSIGFGIQW